MMVFQFNIYFIYLENVEENATSTTENFPDSGGIAKHISMLYHFKYNLFFYEKLLKIQLSWIVSLAQLLRKYQL